MRILNVTIDVLTNQVADGCEDDPECLSEILESFWEWSEARRDLLIKEAAKKLTPEAVNFLKALTAEVQQLGKL